MFFKRFFKSTKAASAIEFAMILPVFVAMIFGCIEFGLIMYGRLSLEYAVSQAARYAYVYNTSSNTQVNNYAKGMVPANYASHLTFTFNTNMVAYTSATITGSFVYSFFLLPLPNITMSSTVVQPLPPS